MRVEGTNLLHPWPASANALTKDGPWRSISHVKEPELQASEWWDQDEVWVSNGT